MLELTQHKQSWKEILTPLAQQLEQLHTIEICDEFYDKGCKGCPAHELAQSVLNWLIGNEKGICACEMFSFDSEEGFIDV